MMIFKKAIPRRMFLQGMGATLALPLLDGMVPAFATSADTAVKTPVRLGIVYVPNGMWPMEKWTPKTEGAYELTPTLEPLSKYKDQFLVLSGLAQKQGLLLPGEGNANHTTTCATFLNGVHPKVTEGRDVRAGVTMDQIAAKELGKDTQFASLEVSLCSTDPVGVCESGWSCIYLSTLSWRTPTTPLPMENKPRALFERLFGDSDSSGKAERLELIRKEKSILDGLTQAVSRLQAGIGPGDRAKLNEYLEAIRDVERRIQLAEKQANREVPKLDRPVGVPEQYDEYAKIMIDLQVVAYQTDLTRVITFVMGREGPYGSRSYPELGISDNHHTLSHHQNNPEAIDKLFQINVYHAQMFAYFLERLKATADGDGNLLDHSLIIYGSGLSNGNIHQHVDLPLLLVGGGGGQIKGGRHIRYPNDTPMVNLHLAVLDKLGLPLDQLGDSTGKLDLPSM